VGKSGIDIPRVFVLAHKKFNSIEPSLQAQDEFMHDSAPSLPIFCALAVHSEELTVAQKIDSISLIGMPGAGKSTVGVILAKISGLRFRDTDLDIQVHSRATLQEILDHQGHARLREIEEQVLLDIPLAQSIISTGGSVVYSASAMARLSAAGPVVYIEASLQTLQQRIAAAPLRGIASSPDQNFAQVFNERTPLYQHYAQYTVSSDSGSADEIAASILDIVTRPDTSGHTAS
jgi:shikimate kinase